MTFPTFEIPLLGLQEANELPWRSTSVPGVSWIQLAADEGPTDALQRKDSRRAGACVLIRMEPGCGYPPHLHLGAEDVLVLQGGYADEFGRHGKGTFVRYPPGSSHAPKALGNPDAPIDGENPACVLFSSIATGIELLEP